MVDGPRGTLRHASAGKIGERAGRVCNKYKVAKHFDLQIAEGSFSYQRKTEQLTSEAALDGIYVVRTCPADQLSTATARGTAALRSRLPTSCLHTTGVLDGRDVGRPGCCYRPQTSVR